ncbi:protein snowy cotyledon 3 [Quercus suber]|uniref:Protein snowy cotyledon 3 n=1 Tax=Quercus suber TaxID=58331 RepID=A0AAW0J004_QUESU
MGEERIVDAHLLRLLYNRYLQWRFVNARADATFKVQRLNSEKNLWNAWVTISELRHSVTLKRIKLLLLRQKLKLTSILRGQKPSDQLDSGFYYI